MNAKANELLINSIKKFFPKCNVTETQVETPSSTKVEGFKIVLNGSVSSESLIKTVVQSGDLGKTKSVSKFLIKRSGVGLTIFFWNEYS